MPAVEVGRICLKVAGREAGKQCVVVDIVDKNFVVITGPPKVSGIRRRRVNINHIEPTKSKIKISKGSSDSEIGKALKTAGILDGTKETAKSTT